MTQIQCPNCRSFKTSSDFRLGMIFGSCLLLIPPVGLLILLGMLALGIVQKLSGKQTMICLDCQKRFTI